jgi:hypothetical protein
VMVGDTAATSVSGYYFLLSLQRGLRLCDKKRTRGSVPWPWEGEAALHCRHDSIWE